MVFAAVSEVVCKARRYGGFNDITVCVEQIFGLFVQVIIHNGEHVSAVVGVVGVNGAVGISPVCKAVRTVNIEVGVSHIRLKFQHHVFAVPDKLLCFAVGGLALTQARRIIGVRRFHVVFVREAYHAVNLILSQKITEYKFFLHNKVNFPLFLKTKVQTLDKSAL